MYKKGKMCIRKKKCVKESKNVYEKGKMRMRKEKCV